MACKQNIISEEYVDLLIRYRNAMEKAEEFYSGYCRQVIDDSWFVLYVPIRETRPLNFGTQGYYTIPKLYGLMEQSSMIESGVLRLRNQSRLNLLGKDIIIGFVDTGIDYLHEVFRNSRGETRILSIWDQSDNTGTTPKEFCYGSEYRRDEINRAIASDDPYSIVPERDEENGHGTFMAGIAAGSVIGDNFTGAAPESSIIMVKLRPAKKVLRDFYLINEATEAYSESDIMLGIKYLMERAIEEGKPLVICLGVGTSYGPHTSGTPLSQMLSVVSDLVKIAVITPMGNEANARHHYQGTILQGNSSDTVELRVGDNEKGFLMELWGSQPDIFSVEIVAPSGEKISRIQASNEEYHRLEFIFEKTVIYLFYDIVETINGTQLITMRFENPSPGIWRIRVFDNNALSGNFHMWLPISEFLSSETYFIDSSPYTTLTQPSSAANPISVGAYNHRNNSIWIDSGRGYAANGEIKPDIVAPGVNIYGPRAGGTHDMYTTRSGTSVSAAHTAGVSALLFEWQLRQNTYSSANTLDIKSLLILGAKRESGRSYPNPEWGYGSLDVYNVFASLINR